MTPGLAVAEELRRRYPTDHILFCGTSRAVEKQMVKSAGFEHRSWPVEPLQTIRSNPWKFAKGNLQACRLASRWMREDRPAAVIGLGGYAMFPGMWAASRAKIPALILEQNALPGRACRWCARFSAGIAFSLEECQDRISVRVPTRVTGNPVRASIQSWTQTPALELADQRWNRPPTILVLGGSQGASGLNRAIIAMLAEPLFTKPREAVRMSIDGPLESQQAVDDAAAVWRPGSYSPAEWMTRSRWIHQTGPSGLQEVRAAYARAGLPARVEPFFPDMSSLYAEATCVISRAGATTLAELACAALPAILVPYPEAVDDHQRLNAEAYSRAETAENSAAGGQVRGGQAAAREAAATDADAGSEGIVVPQTAETAEVGQQLLKALWQTCLSPERYRARSVALRQQARPDAAAAVADWLEELTSAVNPPGK